MLHIIGGKHKKRKLIVPKSTAVRPTASQLREALFNICQFSIEGACFLDLFAGSGAMGLEALSRGAREVTFVEKGRPALAALKKNIAALKEETHSTILVGDVLTVPLKGSFDIIYADPPYGRGLGAALLKRLDSLPILTKEGTLYIEDEEIEELELQNLELRRTRAFGRATLFEYGLLKR
ncbi:MAG: Ribosomal RNA small subunit methyltransferase D [Chlamydiales bacterium]|nr:Ribosomal RNA small subunit methyltransferase D [Chlamydiales bacterium]